MADDSTNPGRGTGNSGSFNPSGGNNDPIIGVNQLQQSIDNFNAAVNKLDAITTRMGQSFQGGQSSYGHWTSSAQQQAGPPSTGGGFSGMLAGIGLGPRRASSGGTASGAGAPPAGGGGPPAPPGSPPGSPPGNGGYNQNPFGPPKGTAKIGGFHIPYTKGAQMAGVLVAGHMISAVGEGQHDAQVNMSSFVQQQQLMAPGNFTGQRFANAARFQAYGGSNRNLNSVANSSFDASAGQSILSNVAGQSANGMGRYTNSFGRNAQSATNALAYVNPGIGYGGAAQIAGALYSPTTSMRMMQMGYQNTFLNFQGGQARAPGQVLGGLTRQLFGGGGRVSSASLNYQLRSGSVGQIAVQQATGITDPGQLQAVENLMRAQTRLTNGDGGQKPLTSAQAGTLLNQAARGNTAAQNQLQKYGVNRSAMQNINNANAAKTGTSADIANSFDSGLQAATTSLTGFRKILDSMARTPFGQAGAAGAGFFGSMSSTGNGLVGLGTSIADLALLRRIGGAGGAAGGVGAGGGLVPGGGGGAAGVGGIRGLIAAGGGTGELVTALAPIAAAVVATAVVDSAITKYMGGHKAYQNNLSQLKAKRTGYLGPIPLTTWADPIVAGGMTATQWAAHQFGSNKAFGVTGKDLGNWGRDIGHLFTGGGSKNGPAQGAGSTHSSGGKFKGGKKNKTAGGISAAANTAVSDAMKEVGLPYIYGGESPGVGFDCSGLVQWSYGQAGVTLPRVSWDQFYATEKRSIDPSQARKGDLVFQAGSDGTTAKPGHVAMMASNTQIVEAPRTGLNVRVRPYSDKEWTHVTRPTGGIGSGGGPISQGGGGGNNPNNPVGNHGLAAGGNAGFGTGAGNYGSSEEVDNVAAALMGGGGGGVTLSSGSRKARGSGGSGGAKGNGGGGSVSAPGPGRVGWAESLLRAIGAPVNQQNKAAVVVWETAEGGGFGNQAANNPLNLNPGPGANWPGHNANGAWAFPTALDGLRETVDYLHMSNFRGINAALQSGKSEHNVLQAIVSSPWAGSHYAGNTEMQSGLRNTTNGRVWGLAGGTNYAPPGMTWMGERGPELRWNSGGEGVSTAQQSHDMVQAQKRPAETMHQAHQPNGLNRSGSSPTVTVTLQFNKGSVCVHGGENIQQQAEKFVDKVHKALDEKKIMSAVASGRNFG